MFKIAKPFFIHTITSLHAGSGDSLGIVDLPIQREKHTSFPKIESSSLKGSLREAFENNKQERKNKIVLSKIKNGEKTSPENENFDYDCAIHLIFGYDNDGLDNKFVKDKKILDFFNDNSEFSGCLAFTDARLLLFPVKSMKGVFVWVTCHYVIKRFKEDMELTGEKCNIDLNKFKPEIGNCIVADMADICINENVILEEYSFAVIEDKTIISELNKYVKKDELIKKLVVLSDDDFKDFVNLSTEVITRTKIDNVTGTVKPGALFNEEYLPPETIMYYLVFASPVFQKVDKRGILKGVNDVYDFFEKGLPEYVQIGGNATIGKGIVRMDFDIYEAAKEDK
ncbi:MAG: type III-B CRISPR module RAMP protein Cmr4 [Bacteroidetes bacterium]|nr:type III-B CRISPR module RAMP protein Cmr4 [Bacteroidota bacterium]